MTNNILDSIVISFVFIVISITTGIYFLLIPVIVLAIYFYQYYFGESKEDKETTDNGESKEDKNNKEESKSYKETEDKEDDDFLDLCIKFIIYSAKYCRCKKISAETIEKTEKFIKKIDSNNYTKRVQNLIQFMLDADNAVPYYYVKFLCTEISKHKRKMSVEEEELFLDALFSAIYRKINYSLIIILLNSLSIVSEGSLSKAKSKYEDIYKKKASSNTNSYKQKQKQKQKEEEARNNQKIIDFTLELLVEAMKVDRSKMVCELDVIKYYILENDKEHFQERVADVKKYLSYEYIELNVEKICDKINKELRQDYRKREDILKIVIELIYADETCTNVELNFLKKVAERLKVSKSSFDFIRMKYENRKNKSGQNRSSKDNYKQNYSGSYDKQQSRSQNNSQNNNSQRDSQPKYSSELEKAYAALGITQEATDRELIACYRNLMRVNHPDVMGSKGQEAVRKATEKCQEINNAFDVVKASRGIK